MEDPSVELLEEEARRAGRHAVLGFFGLLAVWAGAAAVMRTRERRHNPGGNPGSPAVRLVGIGPPPPRPLEHPEVRRRGLPPGTRIELITPEEEARIRELRAQGLEYRQIAEQIHRSVTAVWRTVRREYPPLRRAITTERLRDALLLRRMGLTEEEIGRRLGLSKAMVSVLLHRAGERMDLAAAVEDLSRRLGGVGDRLSPPATHQKLGDGAERLREISGDGFLLAEIKPPETPELLEEALSIIIERALVGEEVLRTGVWCLLRRPVEPLSSVKERLGVCAEAVREAARGLMEARKGSLARAAVVLFEADEMMAEQREVPV